jgi:hypothetical protein
METSLSTRALTRDTARRLLNEGKQPSAKRIYDIIQQGSLSTIQDELNKWWKSIGEQLSDASDNIPEPAMELARTTWEVALKAATQHVQKGLPISAEVSAELATLREESVLRAKQEEDLKRALQASEAVAAELTAASGLPARTSENRPGRCHSGQTVSQGANPASQHPLCRYGKSPDGPVG